MVNELKLTVVHVAHPNPMQICACAWSYHWPKNCGKSGLGCGPSGHWAVAGLLLAKPLKTTISITIHKKMIDFYGFAHTFLVHGGE